MNAVPKRDGASLRRTSLERRGKNERLHVDFLVHHPVLDEKLLILRETLDVRIGERVVEVRPRVELLRIINGHALLLRADLKGFILMLLDPLQSCTVDCDDLFVGLWVINSKGAANSHDEIGLDQTLTGRDRLRARFVRLDDEVGRNESSIIVPRSPSIRRPDRVMTRDNTAVVVDYKFGQKRVEYGKQVAEYAGLLRKMGYGEVEGYIWYVRTGEIARIV